MSIGDIISIISIVFSIVASIISIFAVTNVLKIKQEIRGKDIKNSNITMVGGNYTNNT